MRKLFSFLGSGNYQACRYAYDGRSAMVTRFVQIAIYDLFCRNESEETEAVIFVTKEAYEINWLDRRGGNGELIEGLETAWRRCLPESKPPRMIEIDSRQGESENWLLFEKLYDAIDPGDEIIFDVTHGFRSFPIMALSILNYARILKNASLHRMLYGCFEMTSEQGNKPIIDMTSMVTLLDWTHGVDSYLKTGKASLIRDLMEREARQAYRGTASAEMRREIGILRKLAVQLDEFDQTIQTCRKDQIQPQLSELKTVLHEAGNLDIQHVRPFGKLVDQIERKINMFTGKEIMDAYLGAKWCLLHGYIQQGYTILQESVITAFCLLLQVDPKDSVQRQTISSAINFNFQSKKQDEWRMNEQYIDLFNRANDLFAEYKDQIKPFQKLSDYRNNLNHAGMNDNNFRARKFISELEGMIDDLRPFFEEVSDKASGQ